MTITSMVFIIIVGARMFTIVFIGYEGDDFIKHFLQGTARRDASLRFSSSCSSCS